MRTFHPADQQQGLDDLRRIFVRSLFKTPSLDQKIILVRSALQCYRREPLKDFNLVPVNSKQKGSLSMCKTVSVSFQSTTVSCQDHSTTKIIPTGYLKKRAVTQYQPDDKQITVDQENISSFGEIDLGSSTISFQNKPTCKQSQEIQTCCSFPLSKSLGESLLNKGDEKEDDQGQQTVKLKKDIQKLETKVEKMDEKHNKWKKKAMKRAEKLRLVQNQMKRFEECVKGKNS